MIKTSSYLLCAAAVLALVACGDDGGSSSGSGGGTSGSGGEDAQSSAGNSVSGSGVGSSVASSAASNSASTTVGPSSSSGGDGGNGTGGDGTGGDGTGGNGTGGNGTGGGPIFTACEEEIELFGDPALDTCVNSFCCDQLTVCFEDISLCFDEEGFFDQSLPEGAAFYECSYLAGCFGAAVCDSGIGFGADPEPETLEFAYCLDQNCCAEMNECTDGGANADACIDCLNGDAANFDLCEAVNDCSLTNCEAGLVFIPICDSGLGTANISQGQCLDANCCEAYVTCTGDGSDEDLQACIDCLVEGEGALCDDAITCEAENCSTLICDSGLVIGDVEQAACLTENCCDEHTACTGDGSDEDLEACLECFNAEGGALCDEAIACTEEFCPEA